MRVLNQGAHCQGLPQGTFRLEVNFPTHWTTLHLLDYNELLFTQQYYPSINGITSRTAEVSMDGLPTYCLVSRDIVLVRMNVINLLNRVPEQDSLTSFVLHGTKCK